MFRSWPKKRSQDAKYGNHRSECVAGHSHRSKLEQAVCQMLHLRMKAGEFVSVQAEVHQLICGPIGHECSHRVKIESVVDFKCTKPDGGVVFCEAKGQFETPVWRLKRRLWMHWELGHLEIWGGSASNLVCKEVIGA